MAGCICSSLVMSPLQTAHKTGRPGTSHLAIFHSNLQVSVPPQKSHRIFSEARESRVAERSPIIWARLGVAQKRYNSASFRMLYAGVSGSTRLFAFRRTHHNTCARALADPQGRHCPR
jgi:hypothetical protein